MCSTSCPPPTATAASRSTPSSQQPDRKETLEDVVTYTHTSENSYSGLGTIAVLRLLKAIIVGDVMDDIRTDGRTRGRQGSGSRSL